MALINENFLNLSEDYLFSDIAKKVNAFNLLHPGSKIIRLGVGDVSLPLPTSVISALHTSVDEMADISTFRGYGPEQGYNFLRETIVKNDYEPRGVILDPGEIFISDGAKSDIGNIGDILSRDNRIAVTDPVYPVYIDTNIMGGRAGSLSSTGHWSNIIYIPCTAENRFVPELPEERPDVIYLCYPNNPTGMALSRKELKKWVNYALENEILILFDAAYEAYISDDDVPHSIYEIKGAKEIAIEFRSFSKTAGFTGLRCGFTVIPEELKCRSLKGELVSLNHLWNRRQCTKFNGTAYIVQRAAESVYSPIGKIQVRNMIKYYMRNARVLTENLREIGLEVFGGVNAPYIWIKSPDGLSSWKFFDRLLFDRHIVGTPGVGFGPSGEGYLRLTAFGKYEDSLEAVERFKDWMI